MTGFTEQSRYKYGIPNGFARPAGVIFAGGHPISSISNFSLFEGDIRLVEVIVRYKVMNKILRVGLVFIR